METLNKQRIKIDFKKPVINETLSFRQYDTNIIEAEILENGKPATLNSITSIVANLQRPDQKVFSHVLTPVENVVSFELSNIEMDLVGDLHLAIHFYSSGTRISTTKIKVYMEGSIESGDIPSHEEISVIEGLVQLVNSSLDGITQYGERLDVLEEDVNSRGVNARLHGVQGDIITNDSIRLQALINEVRQRVIDSNFTADNVIVIPAGRYRLETQLIMSPFLKLKAAGLVVFETYVANGSALWITPQADDPEYLSFLRKQQWHRSPILNGTDGGIVFTNKLPQATSNSIAVEFGGREDFGEYRPTARYSVVDVAAQYYDVAFKMNRFRHFLATFDRLHLELNTTCIVFGEPDEILTDSGENMQFINSIFSAGVTGIRWYTDGFDCNFTNCSFDWMDTAFHVSRSYKIITMTGGHFEEIHKQILLEDSTHPSDAAVPLTVRISGVASVIRKDLMFVGSSNVHLTLDGFEFRQLPNLSSNTAIEHSFLVDDRIVLKHKNITFQQRAILPHKEHNHILDWTFEKETLGIKSTNTSLNNYTLQGGNVLYEIVNSDSILGGRALKITGTGGGPWASLSIGKNLKARGGDVLMFNMAIKQAVDTDYTIKVHFYDQNDELIETEEKLYRWMGSLAPKINAWYYPDRAVWLVAPKNTETFKIEFMAHGTALANNSVYLTGLYVTKI